MVGTAIAMAVCLATAGMAMVVMSMAMATDMVMGTGMWRPSLHSKRSRW